MKIRLLNDNSIDTDFNKTINQINKKYKKNFSISYAPEYNVGLFNMMTTSNFSENFEIVDNDSIQLDKNSYQIENLKNLDYLIESDNQLIEVNHYYNKDLNKYFIVPNILKET